MKYMSYTLRKKNSSYYIVFYRTSEGQEYATIQVNHKLDNFFQVSVPFAEQEISRLIKEGYKAL